MGLLQCSLLILANDIKVADLPAAQRIARLKASDAVSFGQMRVKIQYDPKHQPLSMQINDRTLLRSFYCPYWQEAFSTICRPLSSSGTS